MTAAKSDCRAELTAALRATTPEERAAWSAALRAHLTRSPWWAGARTVMMFAAMRYEPDLLPLAAGAGARVLLLPRMEHDRIVPCPAAPVRELVLSPGGIREPGAGAEVDPQTIDLILIPGLGFTPGGIRLGRGRGHYDQFLPRLRSGVPRIGIAFHCQIREALPAEPHDVPMTAVLTEQGILPPPARL